MIRIITLMIFLITPFGVLHARCSELSQVYSNDPNAMTTNDLALLKTCVSKSLREKLFLEEPVPSPIMVERPMAAPIMVEEPMSVPSR